MTSKSKIPSRYEISIFFILNFLDFYHFILARRGGIRPRDWIRPDQCCGPDKPYHTSQKVRE